MDDPLDDLLAAVPLADDLHLYDVTLRDGAQTPGVSFDGDDRRALADALDAAGVAYVEAGYPALGAAEREAVGAARDAVTDATVTALAAADEAEIDAVLDCGLDAVSVYVAGSDVHLAKNDETATGVVERAGEAVAYAADHGLEVRFAVVDATRTPLDRLRSLAATAEGAGATFLGLSDTVGVLTPRASGALVSHLRERVDLALSVHFHDDMDMATANSLAAVEAGASQVHTTVNGIGENGGNTPMAPLAVALWRHHDREVVALDALSDLAALGAERSGLPVHPTAPVVGENAFRYESAVRTAGVRSNPETYEAYPPELVGATRTLLDD